MSEPAELVRMVNIHKWFGKVYALKGVDFTVNKAEVVGLVGDNGAGKSTLIKILSGVYKPDRGEIYFEGRRVSFASPADARRLGIETVYQDQALAPDLSILRNIFMGRELTTSFGFLDLRKMMIESRKALETLGLHVRSPTETVGILSGGERQGVAIARALYFKAKLVILDEPTAALSIKETQKVLDFVKRLKEEGISVIFITHNLYHVYEVADRFVVLFRGTKVADVPKSQTSIDMLSELITTGSVSG
ncbi:MAG TPA: sugar ABC transporter ATP-binding protein [Nitrososphaeria archaeon]|nr:sugar ABC transporter ATP-binding protein [Nitrososphaeria archaeon]